MNICVLGAGYVGFTISNCLASVGNQVFCVEPNTDKCNKINDRIMPIFEKDLSPIFQENLKSQTLKCYENIREVPNSVDIFFVTVGTPPSPDGSANLDYVFSAVDQIVDFVTHDFILVMKSTVPIDTSKAISSRIKSKLDKKNINCHYVSNPEFLKEGVAVHDFMHPDRIVIGTKSELAIKRLKELYAPFSRSSNKLQIVSPTDAEMIKYVSNSFLATKIGFMNQIAAVCDKVGANIHNIRRGLGSDSRVSEKFLYAGCGFGGSCFPKDLREMVSFANKSNVKLSILEEVLKTNAVQKLKLVDKITIDFGQNLSGLTFAIWGCAFKPGTDDVRESSALSIVERLISLGARLQVHDPEALEQFDVWVQNNGFSESVKTCNNQYEALKNAHAMILCTEWLQYRSPDFKSILGNLKSRIIYDGRNLYDPKDLKEMGLGYRGIGLRNSLAPVTAEENFQVRL